MLEQGFTYTTSEGSRPGITILTLEGPFTIGNIFQLQTDLRNLRPACLIMDLKGVPYMDSAGLGVIMNAFVSAQSGGRKLRLVHVNERVQSLLEMTKVDSLLPSYNSLEAAEDGA